MILVTGATGNIGSEVVRQLVGAGVAVRVLTRDPAKAAKLGPGVAVAQGDLTRPDTLAAAFEGAEKALLLAGAQDLPAAARHAAEAAKRSGTRHIVLISSASVLMQPPNAIGRWHLDAEEAVKAAGHDGGHPQTPGLAWTMLRPGNFASNTLRWAPTIRAEGAVFSASRGKSAPIDPRDIASVAVKALTAPGHEGRAYALTGPELLSEAEQVEILGTALGKALRWVPVPEEAARAGMLRSGLNEELVDAVLEMLRWWREGEPLCTSTVREVTGVEARPFAVWARDHVAAFAG
jgi:uncharacterized protein YbjT (DUF2867 family)